MAKKLKYENYIPLLALLAGLPAVIVMVALLWQGDFTGRTRWTLVTLVLAPWLGAAFVARERLVRPLQTMANLLAALREEDFSIRARGARRDDALGELMLEVNALGATLREQRLGALEATALLRTVMAEIDVAVFAFDGGQRLRMVNRGGERFMAQPAERLLGRTAAELGLADCLQGEAARTVQMTLSGGLGRWGMRRSVFREHGRPHQLLVLTDLSHALREEERQAWQRLLRVLGHELNNSLAPIKSIAGSMESLLRRQPRPEDWEEDMRRGLEVISTRAGSLNRFMDAYSRLARLPPPRVRPLSVSSWVQRVVALETRLPVALQAGPEINLQADGDQLDQLLINVLRNAVDAVLESRTPGPSASSAGATLPSLAAQPETEAEVTVGWKKAGPHLEVFVEDNGPGVSNTANLFVPLFTTKPGGSGIGLALSRQIAEAHGGSLTLENRAAGHGCIARLRLRL